MKNCRLRQFSATIAAAEVVVMNVKHNAVIIAGVLCTVPGIMLRAALMKAAEPGTNRIAIPTAHHADMLIFPKGHAEVAIPFTVANGVPVTSSVRINGKFLGRFIIDTGAQETFVSRAVANRCRLPAALQLHLTCKRCRVDIRRVRQLQIGSITVVDDAIGTEDFGRVATDRLTKRVVGSIGGDILGRMPFSIDYRDSKVIFYNPKSFRAPQGATEYPIKIAFGSPKTKDGILASRLFVRMGVPTVTGRLRGKPVQASLDTGSTLSVMLMPAFIRKNPELINQQRFVMSMQDFMLQGQLFGARNISVGILGNTVNNPRHIYALIGKPWQLRRGRFSDLDIIVGGRFLRSYRLTFDYAAGKMWVQWYPPRSFKVQLARGLNPNRADITGETPLMHAAFHKDLAGVQALLRAGANPLAKDKSGVTVLDYAAMGGNSMIIKSLLAGPAKTDINYGGAAWTPLGFATAHKGDEAAWRTLVQAGAAVNPSPNPTHTPLGAAVQGDNITAIRWLIRHGANVNGTNRDHHTPLMMAAWTGNFRAFALLRAHGASLSIKGHHGNNLLSAAAAGGQVAMIKFLLSKAGGSFAVNTINAFGETPLIGAADSGEWKAARLLLRSGADVNHIATGKSRQAALLYAARHEQPKMLDLLIRHGAKVNARNWLGATPLMAAAFGANTGDIRLLLKAGADVNARDLQGDCALMLAARTGCVEPVAILLAHGADVNVSDNAGRTPLMAAVAENGSGAVDALIKAGANVTAKAAGKQLISAIDIAAEKGKRALISELIRHGANVNSTDALGRTPLLFAVANGHPRVVSALIRSGADVNARIAASNNMDVLEFAAQFGNPRIVDDLIRHGAKVNSLDRLGHTALMIAVVHGNLSAAVALIQAAANIHVRSPNSRLGVVGLAAAHDQPKLIRSLISHGANADQRCALNRTPLMLAASKGFLACVQALLRAGASVNSQDDNGYTPLEAAAGDGRAKTAALLIHAGAKVNLADHFGMTPLDYACLAKHPSAMVRLLLKAGANPKMKDRKGRNALYYAGKSGSGKAMALVGAAIRRKISEVRPVKIK